MRIGKLSERITIEDFTIAQNDYGEELQTWESYASLWAEVRQPSANERFQGRSDRESATVQYQIKIRFRDDIAHTMRVVWRNKILDIVSITDPDGSRTETILGCNEYESQ